MIKNVAKISAVTAAKLLLAGCFSASSLNRDAQAPVAPQVAPVVEETVTPAKEYTLSGDFLWGCSRLVRMLYYKNEDNPL